MTPTTNKLDKFIQMYSDIVEEASKCDIEKFEELQFKAETMRDATMVFIQEKHSQELEWSSVILGDFKKAFAEMGESRLRKLGKNGPSLEEFLKLYQDEHKLYPYQIKLAEALINYRNIHFSGGHRSGRTYTINLVNKYFKEQYPMTIHLDVIR